MTTARPEGGGAGPAGGGEGVYTLVFPNLGVKTPLGSWLLGLGRGLAYKLQIFAC